jgi:hypothetical protein
LADTKKKFKQLGGLVIEWAGEHDLEALSLHANLDDSEKRTAAEEFENCSAHGLQKAWANTGPRTCEIQVFW